MLINCPLTNRTFPNLQTWRATTTRLGFKSCEQEEAYNRLWKKERLCKFPGCHNAVPFHLLTYNACTTTHHNQERRIRRGDYKLEDLIFECKLDGLRFIRKEDIGDHLRKNYKFDNAQIKNYYDRFLKTESDGICKWCSKPTTFQSIALGYAKFCYNKNCNVLWYNKHTDRKEKAAAGIKRSRARGDCIPTQLGYWVKTGLSLEDAKIKLRERQTTNTVDKIALRRNISLEDAKMVRKEITEKWSKKTHTGAQYSRVSQELFWAIHASIKDKLQVDDIFFATYDKGNKISNKNMEYRLRTKYSVFKLDFYIQSLNLAIEFDGDYWHSGAWRRGKRRKSDTEREEELINSNVSVLHVREKDFRTNKEATVKNCIDFIYGRMANS